MIETARTEAYLHLLDVLNIQETAEKMIKDPLLKHVVYDAPDGNKLVIVNASKSLHSPEEPHHMLAKGIVFSLSTSGKYRLVALPFSKFYNSFEGPAQRDIEKYALEEGVETVLVRKMDGTLINRWVYGGVVYFSTRGRILNFEKNEFWDLVNKIINTGEYPKLTDPKCAQDSTMMFELVGPSNVIIELHPKDDLVLIGINVFNGIDININSEYRETLSRMFNVVSVYDGSDPLEVINAFDGIREGLIVNYVKTDAYGKSVVLFRVKHKQEEYLKLVRAKNQASPQRLFEIALEKAFKSFDEVEVYMKEAYADSGYIEELLNYYRNEWSNIDQILNKLREDAFEVYKYRDELRSIEDRKSRYFKAKELVGDNRAGLCMQIVDGKMGYADLVAYFGKGIKL